MSVQRTKSRYTRIWAATKAIGLSKDDLHQIVERDYDTDSLTKLSDKQVDSLGNHLWDMANGRQLAARPRQTVHNRTDEGGSPATIKQRKKIYMLATSMGWTPADIDAFSKQRYGSDSHKWLSPKQCSDMIEALNAMSTRKAKTSAVQ